MKFKNGDSVFIKTADIKGLDEGYDKTEPVFTETEVEASFPGGQDAWTAYLIKNLKYPQKAVENKIQGDVIVQFIVNKEGNISHVEAISGPDELKEEAVRAVRESGKWTPAIQNGKNVTSYKKQPIRYRLNANNT